MSTQNRPATALIHTTHHHHTPSHRINTSPYHTTHHRHTSLHHATHHHNLNTTSPTTFISYSHYPPMTLPHHITPPTYTSLPIPYTYTPYRPMPYILALHTSILHRWCPPPTLLHHTPTLTFHTPPPHHPANTLPQIIHPQNSIFMEFNTTSPTITINLDPAVTCIPYTQAP